MKNSKTIWMLAGAAVGFSGLSALAGEPVSRDEVRSIVAEMLADAETRSSLLAGGGDAGYDKNFFMASADGNYRLNISGYMQIRYTMNFRDGAPGNTTLGIDDYNGGFSMRQTKIAFHGNVVNPDLTFRIEGLFESGDRAVLPWTFGAGTAGFNTGGGGLILDDAWVNYAMGHGWSVRGGQYKSYFLKEDNNADVYTMAAERGMVNAAFGQGRVQGIGAKYTGDQWWVGFDITDGFRTQNTDFTSSGESDLAATGRFEWRFAGTNDQLKDYTSMPGDPMGAMIGAAVHYQMANNDPFFVIDQNYLSYTVDGQIEGSGLSLFAAFVGSHTWNNATGPGDPPDFDDFGVTVQGLALMQNDEIFVRWDGIFLDDQRPFTSGGFGDTFNFITFGYNHYFAGHAAKLTIDCIMSLNHTVGLDFNHVVPNGNPIGAFGSFLGGQILPDTHVGLLGTSTGIEAAVRFQFQLMF